MTTYKNILVLMIFAIFINLLSSNVYASEQINFENITIDDGLSQSTAEAIFQDSDGYIWIGTNDGLNRYNGLEMKIFRANNKDENSIVSSYIISITEDSNKNLWVATDRGVSRINLKDYSIKNYRYYDNNKKTPYENIHNILVTKKNNILMGTYDGVYMYNKEKDDFDKIIDENNGLTSVDIADIKEDKYNNLWIGTTNGLNKIDTKSKKIYKYTNEEGSSVKWNDIKSILCDNEGNIWVSTFENGINKINVKTNKITSYKLDENNEYSIPSNSVRQMLQDRNGTIWISTEKGLSKYVGQDKFTTYTNKSYDDNSLLNNIVHTLMEDSSGLIWVGTYTGISVFDPKNEITQYKNDPLDENSISDNVIHGIYEDKDNLLWVGTRDRGLNIIDRENNKISHIYEGNSAYDLSTNSVKIIIGKDNTIWIGTRDGINEIDKNTMTIKKYTREDGLVSNNIKSLLIDSRGYLWIGTPDGLNILDTKTNKIRDITPILRKYGGKEIYIEEIFEDKNGVYWIGDYISSGLIEINPYKEYVQIHKIFEPYGDEENINNIKSITEDEHNNLWIGTNSGLIKFNKSNKEFKRYTDEDGLANNTVYGVLFDTYGNPWMSTNNGISKLDISNNKFRNLYSTDGLQSNEFNGKAYYKCENGDFLFGGVKGLNSFNPSKISQTLYSPKVTFDDFQVSGRSYPTIDNMTFEYYEDPIRIKYFIPEYKKNNNIKYYYKLEGSNDNWIQTSTNEVIFNDLNPGKYTFKIKARSQYGTVVEESSVTFTIKPPIWKSTKAIILYLFLIVLLVRLNINKVNKLDRLVEERTKELSDQMEKNNILFYKLIEAERSKNNYFINLSHELRTPLNVINSVEQLITNFSNSEKGISQDKLIYYMDVMRSNTKRLLNLINNIIDTSKVENGKYKIHKEDNDIVYIVEESTLSLKETIESSGIDLIIDTDVEEKIISCDKYEIERCIVNLVSNAAKFTNPGGTITVDIKDLDKEVMIIVSDTGVGIEKKYHESIFDRFNQVIDEESEVKGGSGLGLTITKHIVDLHDGKIYVESEKDKGTKFIIILPRNSKNENK